MSRQHYLQSLKKSDTDVLSLIAEFKNNTHTLGDVYRFDCLVIRHLEKYIDPLNPKSLDKGLIALDKLGELFEAEATKFKYQQKPTKRRFEEIATNHHKIGADWTNQKMAFCDGSLTL